MDKSKDNICSDPVVITGIGGRYPMSRNPEEFWTNLCSGIELCSMDDSRWPVGESHNFNCHKNFNLINRLHEAAEGNREKFRTLTSLMQIFSGSVTGKRTRWTRNSRFASRQHSKRSPTPDSIRFNFVAIELECTLLIVTPTLVMHKLKLILWSTTANGRKIFLKYQNCSNSMVHV